jgi:hypothetical protein
MVCTLFSIQKFAISKLQPVERCIHISKIRVLRSGGNATALNPIGMQAWKFAPQTAIPPLRI